MTETSTLPAGIHTPIRNMRIHFWGVQGSCALFPETNEVDEYRRMLAVDLLEKVIEDVARHSRNGHGCRVEDLLGGPANEASIADYQRKLGGIDLPVYGGDTTCISVETSEGNVLVFDGGSGIRNCSKTLVQRWDPRKPRELHIFGTHEHLDHRSGLPFTQFCYVKPPFMLNILGSFQFLNALDERYGIFSRQLRSTTHLDDPIDFRMFSATFRGQELRNGNLVDFRPSDGPPPWVVRDIAEPIKIGATTITAFDVYHGGTRCLAYKVEHGTASFVFCTDHEIRHGPNANDPRQIQSQIAEERLRELSKNADVAYYDGQYMLDEYMGRRGIGNTQSVSRLDWGHGCIEDVIERVRQCGVKRAYIGHHDPERTWPARLQLDRWLQKLSAGEMFHVELARSGDAVDV